MLTYIIRRLLLLVPTLVGVTAVVFFTMALAPGDPASLLMDTGGEVDAEQARAMQDYYRERYGLDRPMILQYTTWLNRISPIGHQHERARVDLQGVGIVWSSGSDGEPGYSSLGFKPPDLGYSWARGRAVLGLIGDRLPITMLLSILSTPVVYIVALISGIYAARHRNGLFDRISGTFYLALWSVPVIWAGVLLIGFIASEEFVRWFPASGISHVQAGRMSFFPTAGALGHSVGFALYVLLWLALLGSLVVAGVMAGYLAIRALLVVKDRRSPRRHRRGSVLPGAVTLVVTLLLLLVSAAVINLGLLPQRMAGLERGWLIDRLWHLLLPVVCLSYAGLAFLSKLARGAVLENLHADFARTARAKGLDDRTVLFRHVFRNSLLPMITVFVAIFPGLISGSVVVEQIFGINGMGRLAVESIVQRDREVVMAITLIGGLLGLMTILIQDILYAIADPRVSYE